MSYQIARIKSKTGHTQVIYEPECKWEKYGYSTFKEYCEGVAWVDNSELQIETLKNPTTQKELDELLEKELIEAQNRKVRG